KKLIDTVKINQFFRIAELNKQSKVLLVTITDDKGKKRFGMYYPGQKTVYELDKEGGKQTKNPLGFAKKNKNKFQIQVVNPTDAHFKARTSVDRKVMSPDGLEQGENMKKLEGLRKDFAKLKGKLANLDLKKLNKFAKEYKPYNSNLILFGEKRILVLSEITRKHGLKVLNKILRAEIAVLNEGIKKLKTKPAATTASPGAPSASRRPGKRPKGAETEKPSPELLTQIRSLSEGDGVTFTKDGVKMAVFKDSKGKLHYITDLSSGDSSGPKKTSDFKDLTIDTTKPITKIDGKPLFNAMKKLIGPKKGKTLTFTLANGKKVRAKLNNSPGIFQQYAIFSYSIGGTPQGVVDTRKPKTQVVSFARVSTNLKPGTVFSYE
ncbi:hypothetical protein ACFL3C_04850, partial [Patescibacteria group bacterium]